MVRLVLAVLVASAALAAQSRPADDKAFPNTKPFGRATIQFEVRDDWSSISKVEYSLDAQRWQVIYPRDGIFDSRSEQFELTLDNDTATRGLIIRAFDARNNSVTARGDVPTPR